MGQFKPMVKMFTNEPKVILKLKKGGKVAQKGDGFKTMHKMSESSMYEAAENGKSPKRPSMAARRRAMNPQFKKGGKVAHREMGGGMPMAAPMARAPMAAMGRAKLAKMAPAVQAARLAQVRKALTGMKKGGSTASCAALERELKHHESMSSGKAHPQKKADGGSITARMAKTTIKGNAGKFVNTDMETADRKNSAKGTGKVKNGAAGYANGGTISGNEGKFKNTMMVTADRRNSASGTKGVRMGNVGGFKKGGKIVRKASGGGFGNSSNMLFPEEKPQETSLPYDPNRKPAGNKTGLMPFDDNPGFTPLNTDQQRSLDAASNQYNNQQSSSGFTPLNTDQQRSLDAASNQYNNQEAPLRTPTTPSIQNQQDYSSSSFMSPTQMRSDQQAPDTFYRKNSFTKGLGYKAGGNVNGGWENRPANTAKAGVKNTSTGEVKEANAGGYKRGGSAKKAYATGGDVVDDGKAEKMPRHFKSQPVANSLQSGTFKRGGKVRKGRAYGGSC